MDCHRTLSIAFWLSGGRAMTRWEYHFIQVTNGPFLHSGTVPDFITKLGGDGWELVGFDVHNQALFRTSSLAPGYRFLLTNIRQWPFARASGACPGFLKDHIKPLACGGPDAVWNMQWQTVAAAKAKDRWELGACGR